MTCWIRFWISPSVSIQSSSLLIVRFYFSFAKTATRRRPARLGGQTGGAGYQELPDDWNLYFLLGFIHYMERHDYIAAAEAFERGSRVPNAHPFLKVMAARMRTQGGDREPLACYGKIFTTPILTRRCVKNAVEHLDALLYDQIIEQIQQRVQLAKIGWATCQRIGKRWCEPGCCAASRWIPRAGRSS